MSRTGEAAAQPVTSQQLVVTRFRTPLSLKRGSLAVASMERVSSLAWSSRLAPFSGSTLEECGQVTPPSHCEPNPSPCFTHAFSPSPCFTHAFSPCFTRACALSDSPGWQ